MDIRRDGGLDLPDGVLDELEWVHLSLHGGQRDSREALTRKVIQAMQHPSVRCLRHPTGRLINHRPPNALDLEQVFGSARNRGWDRDQQASDANSTGGLRNMELADRDCKAVWATTRHLVNTMPGPDALSRPAG